MPETDNSIIPLKTKSRLPRWVRGLTATAAVLVILITGSVTAKAFGFNIWQAVVQWTQETFHFGDWGNSNADNSLPYASLQEALEKGNVPIGLAPTFIPEGFNLTEIDVQKTPKNNIYTARYTCREKVLVIAVRDYLDGVPYYVEQSDGLIEEYQALGITYYLFDNNKQARCAWIVDSYECSIFGDVTIDELKTMINSIEKG